MIKLYCGGTFPFFYLDKDYEENVKKDYRVNLLCDSNLLLKKQDIVMINKHVQYVGPFYFESDGMVDEEIVSVEKEMLTECTHAVFLLKEASCPGTIAELIYAASVGKPVAIFYVQSKNGEEIESNLHTPCWFPIIFSQKIYPEVKKFPCASYDEASQRIKEYVFALSEKDS